MDTILSNTSRSSQSVPQPATSVQNSKEFTDLGVQFKINTYEELQRALGTGAFRFRDFLKNYSYFVNQLPISECAYMILTGRNNKRTLDSGGVVRFGNIRVIKNPQTMQFTLKRISALCASKILWSIDHDGTIDRSIEHGLNPMAEFAGIKKPDLSTVPHQEAMLRYKIYWAYVPGNEFLFDEYPELIYALSEFKVDNRANLKLLNEEGSLQSPEEILTPYARQVTQRYGVDFFDFIAQAKNNSIVQYCQQYLSTCVVGQNSAKTKAHNAYKMMKSGKTNVKQTFSTGTAIDPTSLNSSFNSNSDFSPEISSGTLPARTATYLSPVYSSILSEPVATSQQSSNDVPESVKNLFASASRQTDFSENIPTSQRMVSGPEYPFNSSIAFEPSAQKKIIPVATKFALTPIVNDETTKMNDTMKGLIGILKGDDVAKKVEAAKRVFSLVQNKFNLLSSFDQEALAQSLTLAKSNGVINKYPVAEAVDKYLQTRSG